MTIFNEIMTFTFFKGIVKSYVEGSRKVKFIMTLNFLVLIGAILFLALTEKNNDSYHASRIIAAVIAGINFITFIWFYAYQLVVAEQEVTNEIKKVEDRAKEHPNEPTASWDLARIKLESYLNRNLAQIRWIFYWTVFIMLVGFALIGYGIYKVYQSNTISASIVTVISGLLVEFIGATFLIVYKSTMEQAKEFINVLERINAVGMSVQIIDRIEEDQQLKNKSGAKIARQLLELYGLLK